MPVGVGVGGAGAGRRQSSVFVICPESALWKAMDWSNAIFHGLRNVILIKY